MMFFGNKVKQRAVVQNDTSPPVPVPDIEISQPQQVHHRRPAQKSLPTVARKGLKSIASFQNLSALEEDDDDSSSSSSSSGDANNMSIQDKKEHPDMINILFEDPGSGGTTGHDKLVKKQQELDDNTHRMFTQVTHEYNRLIWKPVAQEGFLSVQKVCRLFRDKPSDDSFFGTSHTFQQFLQNKSESCHLFHIVLKRGQLTNTTDTQKLLAIDGIMYHTSSAGDDDKNKEESDIGAFGSDNLSFQLSLNGVEWTNEHAVAEILYFSEGKSKDDAQKYPVRRRKKTREIIPESDVLRKTFMSDLERRKKTNVYAIEFHSIRETFLGMLLVYMQQLHTIHSQLIETKMTDRYKPFYQLVPMQYLINFVRNTCPGHFIHTDSQKALDEVVGEARKKKRRRRRKSTSDPPVPMEEEEEEEEDDKE